MILPDYATPSRMEFPERTGQFAGNQIAEPIAMLRGLIAFCLLRRPLVLAAYVAFLGLGLVAFNALNIEAYPDPAPPIIEIIAQRPGQSPPEELERYVTIPIEIAVASTPGGKSPLPGVQARHNKPLVSWGPLVIVSPLAGSLLARLRCAAPC